MAFFRFDSVALGLRNRDLCRRRRRVGVGCQQGLGDAEQRDVLDEDVAAVGVGLQHEEAMLRRHQRQQRPGGRQSKLGQAAAVQGGVQAPAASL